MSKASKHQLERLKEQREKLNARIQSAEAKIKTSERKKDTRRKILIGSYHLDQAKKFDNMEDLKKIMDDYLKRDYDRELFELKPLRD